MTTTIDDNSVVPDSTAIDDTDSTYTTSGEDIIEVDTSGGAVTVQLATADVKAGRTIEIIDDGSNAGTNNITVNTEGSETIGPGGASSKTIAVDDARIILESNGTNWNATNRNVERESVVTDQASIGQVVGRAESNNNQTVSTSTVTQVNLNIVNIEDTDILSVDTSNDKISVTTDGTYLIRGKLTWLGSTNWSSGDLTLARVSDDTNDVLKDDQRTPHPGVDESLGMNTSALYTVSGNTDFVLEAYHERGGDETIEARPKFVFLEVVRIG